MKYPVQKTDFKNDIASDDEQATMIVIEAILSNTFDSLEFKDQNPSHSIREAVTNWEKFDDFSNTILGQKGLLNRVISSSEVRLDAHDQALSDSIASQVFESSKQELKKNKQTKMMGALSVAAGFIIIAIGITSVLSSLNTGTKSSSTKSASVQTTSSPNQEKSSSADSIEGTDDNNMRAEVGSKNPEALSLTPENEDKNVDSANKSNGDSMTDQKKIANSNNYSSDVQSSWNRLKIAIVSTIGIVVFVTLTLGLLRVKRRKKARR